MNSSPTASKLGVLRWKRGCRASISIPILLDLAYCAHAGRQIARDNPRDHHLKNPNDRSFTDRQANSAKAKQALLERFQARPKADDPAMAARRAEREAIAQARAERENEKAKIRAENERLEALERERIAELKRQEEIAREVARKAEQAKRDAERPRKVLLEAVQYMQLRTAGKRR
ncbi:DUF6481 family protein [Bosea sp. BH3]|uniref:DUF6481 family protein n=1 Tax=Bosea sp. BH3 TaxID=2871701 RepID=UPI0021CB1BDD|nr:DUF6481 family protein [Bosea sp. BH3]MCU4178582.1 DUF6481 family protein [Bosea sp. BH3]